jgi:hypothetical protein
VRTSERPANLNSAQATSALYIDFEGGQNLPPSFIGIRTHEDGVDFFEQVIVERVLYRTLDLQKPYHHSWPKGYAHVEASMPSRVRPVRRADTFSGMVASLVNRAESEDRLIVSWSSYDRDAIVESEVVPPELKARFVTRWRDAKALAKAWKRRVHPARELTALPGHGTHRLDCYMELVGYKLPSHFGDRKAAARIAYVRGQLQDGRPAEKLTPVAKAKWTKVLDYNWHDCNGMREVTIRPHSGWFGMSPLRR